MSRFLLTAILCSLFLGSYAQTDPIREAFEADDAARFVVMYDATAADSTLLHKSVRAGAFKITEFLISQKISTNGYDSNGQTPLHIAVESEDQKMVSMLLLAGADPNKKTRGGLGATPLMLAASLQDPAISSRLLQAGAQVNAVDVNGDPALNWAAYYGHTDQMRLLIKAGADLSLRSKHGDVADVVLRLWQPDSVSEVLRNTSMARKLPRQVARLVEAVKTNDVAAAEKLLQAGTDANSTDGLSIPVLQIAAEKGQADMVSLLLRSGANPNKLNRVGQTPLAFAARFGQQATIELLLRQGAEVNATDDHYRLTPLIGAAINGDTAIVGRLIKAGAKIDHTDAINQCSALHWALFYGHTAVVELLVKSGAKVDMKVLDGRYTAYSLAKFYGNDKAAALVEDRLNENNPLLGSWKFKSIHYIYQDTTLSVANAFPGTFVVAPHRYAIMYNPSNRPRTAFESLAEPTDLEIKSAFQSIVFNSGTYELSDSLVTTTSDIARVPGFEGGKQYYQFKIDGNELSLRMIDETYPDGSKPAWFKKLEVLFILSKE